MTSKKPWLNGLYAALYSWGISAFTIVSTAVGIGYSLGVHGGFTDPATFVEFIKNAWFGCLIGLIFQVGPYVRGKQGFAAAADGKTPPPEQNQAGVQNGP
jgi:hypothetical protein